ncbi:NADP-dependent 3-hydroxy acid dehydrogenase YdfG [Rhodoligotrophos appendicifer]|uniref:SDR family oxidoreductase n=1 Tax=Rhodoligotrophos appendicifer TaxID=987056 RepID=UPI001186BB24|nr:SDR family NAD(P)-dependent oxidoreductase [Rhodoligotrophos appendicifer]
MSERTVLVTGATSGIGEACALALLEAGARIVATGRRIERLAPLSARFGEALHLIAADLSEPGAAARLMAQLPPDWAIDTLVYAAGHDAGGKTSYHEADEGDLAAKLSVNLTSLADLAQILLPAWLARDAGDLVAIGSIVSREAVAGLADYGMTKHALHGLMAGLRLDYAATGLRFIEIIPGVVRTEFALSRWQGDVARAEEFYARFKQYLLPEDVAASVLWALRQPAHVALDEIILRPTRR